MRARSFDLEHLVTFEETNLVGNVYFTNHLRWQGHCREQFLSEHAPGVLAALGDSFALSTVRCSCDYFAELNAFDRITIRMTLSAVQQNRLQMRFDYIRTVGDHEELVARGEQETACMQRTEEGLRPAPIPAELQRALAEYA